jgi:hypothetical protein
MPPKLTKQNGSLTTSANLTGSQNPTVIPMRGMGEPQAQTGLDGFDVSYGSAPSATVHPPMDMGNKQLQHTSVTGFVILPVQVAFAVVTTEINIKISMTDFLIIMSPL